jgi:hypothetical protein
MVERQPLDMVEMLKKAVDAVPEATILEGAADTIAVLIKTTNGNERVVNFTGLAMPHTTEEGGE